MKTTIFRYGIYATLAILILGAINLFVIAEIADNGVQEIAGYLAILISMLFVFFGIRHFRNRMNGGSLTFGEGLKVGVLIVLIPAVFFGLFTILYTELINPDWVTDYYNNYIETLKKSTPPEKLDAAIKKAEQQREMFSGPVMQFLVMAGTVFIIGFIVTIISTLSLRRNKMATA